MRSGARLRARAKPGFAVVRNLGGETGALEVHLDPVGDPGVVFDNSVLVPLMVSSPGTAVGRGALVRHRVRLGGCAQWFGLYPFKRS